MNVTSISKIQIQEKQRTLPGTAFLEELNAAKVGMTATQYLIPTDKFIILKDKYDLKEEDQPAPLSPPLISSSEKVTAKKTLAKKCSVCSRAKRK